MAILDSSGGLTNADKACRFALHKARRLGARFILHADAGAFASFTTSAGGKVEGIKTKDGKSHPGDLTIMACGAWTPSLLPELDGLCEATAGSVILYRIPRSSSLWDRTSPDRFPTWAWKMRDGAEGGVYGFPRDEQGYMKLGYRGTKYTNPKVQIDGKEGSASVTRWSAEDSGEELKKIPAQAMKVLRGFVDEYLPELNEDNVEVAHTRLCWYTDTFDNHFLVDRVPGREGLLVATGGSGHAFKYLPNIGKWVVDVIEDVDVDRPAIVAWRWRCPQGKKPMNVLMEGSKGSRALGNVRLIDEGNIGPKGRARL